MPEEQFDLDHWVKPNSHARFWESLGNHLHGRRSYAECVQHMGGYFKTENGAPTTAQFRELINRLAIKRAGIPASFLTIWNNRRGHEEQIEQRDQLERDLGLVSPSEAEDALEEQQEALALAAPLGTARTYCIFGACDEKTIRFEERSISKDWVRCYEAPLPKRLISLRGDHSIDVIGRLDESIVIHRGGIHGRHIVSPMHIVTSYRCDGPDGIQKSGPLKNRKKRPVIEGLAQVPWSPATFTEPAPEPVDPLAGCTRDSVLAKGHGKRTNYVREIVREEIDKLHLVLLAAGTTAAGKPGVFEVHDTYKNGLGIDVADVAFYLTAEAVKVMKMRLDPETQAEVNQRVAMGVPATQPTIDYDRMAQIIASTVAATMAPFLDRMMPAQATPMLPAGAVVVERHSDRHPFTQSAINRKFGLPERGDHSAFPGEFARANALFDVEPWSKRYPHAGPTGLHEGHVMYAQCFVDRIAPVARERSRRMFGCGWRMEDGLMVRLDAGSTSKTEVLRQMAEVTEAFMKTAT